MLKILIAEDDLLVADLLEDVLLEKGYEVCGIGRTVQEAVDLGKRTNPDLAVLDLRLAEGGLGTDVAKQLQHKGHLGVLYASGNLGHVELTRADGEASIGKPYRPIDVVRALEIVEQVVTTGTASRPFPPGFRLLDPAPQAIPTEFTDKQANELRRLLRQQTALAQFGGFAFRESDLGKVLTEAARVCAEGLNVPFSKVCRHREEEHDLLVEAGVGWHQGVIGCVVSRADETSPQGRAFITGKPVICPDLMTDTVFILPSFYAEHGIVSTVDVLIKGENEKEPYGVLEVDSPVAHTYDQQDIDFLTGFANVLAEAVTRSVHNSIAKQTLTLMKDMVGDRDRLLLAKNRALEEKENILQDKNRLLAEKSLMAQELQHRVRNNLQLVYGMLAKQLQGPMDELGKAGISAIARRVMTLAQIYDHLLGTGLSRTIEFSAYLSSMCGDLKERELAEHPDIDLIYRGEPIFLDLDTVTALGLVTTELLANCYRHAFPAGKGKILVSLHAEGSAAVMTIADDGIGFLTEHSDGKRRGVELMRRLMEQISGTATIDSAHGTLWTLTFPVNPANGAIEANGDNSVQ